jgi:hypothetical protein
MILQTIPVFMTEEEAKQFLMFQKSRTLIELLEHMGAFKLKNASITLHFDHAGVIKTVTKDETFHL